MIEVTQLQVQIDTLTLLSNVSFHLSPGQWLMVAGPNGAGKSTLIHALSGTVPYSGEVRLMGTPRQLLSSKQQAKIIGVLSQQHSVNYSFTVEEVVRLGRYCHAPKIFSNKNTDDQEKVRQALEMTGMWGQRQQSVLSLSGGELQRVFLAQIFAQEPSILLLDEPTNHLDIGYQSQLFPMIQNWLEPKKRAVLSVVHDLCLARRYGNQALLLHQGHVLAYGKKEDVFSSLHLNAAYGIPVEEWMRQLYEPWQKTNM